MQEGKETPNMPKVYQKKTLVIISVVTFLVAAGIGIASGFFIRKSQESGVTTAAFALEIPEANVNAMYDTMKLLKIHLEKHKVEYFLHSGTLIGAKRNLLPG
jgi:hypothetical protein